MVFVLFITRNPHLFLTFSVLNLKNSLQEVKSSDLTLLSKIERNKMNAYKAQTLVQTICKGLLSSQNCEPQSIFILINTWYMFRFLLSSMLIRQHVRFKLDHALGRIFGIVSRSLDFQSLLPHIKTTYTHLWFVSN